MTVTESPLDREIAAPAAVATPTATPTPEPLTSPNGTPETAKAATPKTSRRRRKWMLGAVFMIAVVFVTMVFTPLVVTAQSPGDVNIDDLAIEQRVVPIPPSDPGLMASSDRSVILSSRDTSGTTILVGDDTTRGDDNEADDGEEAPSYDPSIATLNELLALGTIGFESGSDEPTAEAKDGLREVATYLKANPRRVIIGSHTDDTGGSTLNQTLSQQRAELVRDRLIGMGVDEDLLVPIGFGESTPIESNETEEGREANRRIEFVLVDNLTFGASATEAAPDTNLGTVATDIATQLSQG